MIEAHAKGISLRFKIRASAIHQIMANGRGTDSMGETCMTYCKNWILEQPEFISGEYNIHWLEKKLAAKEAAKKSD